MSEYTERMIQIFNHLNSLAALDLVEKLFDVFIENEGIESEDVDGRLRFLANSFGPGGFQKAEQKLWDTIEALHGIDDEIASIAAGE